MLNMCDEQLYQKVLELDEKLDKRSYDINNYQLLGVDLNCNSEELERNYNILQKLINTHQNCFSNKEIESIREAYKSFKSFLGAAWYEHEIGSAGARNTNLLYENNKKFENFFDDLSAKKGQIIDVNYLKNSNDSFNKKFVTGELKSVVAYDSINIVSNGNVPEKIDFLSEDSAITNIYDKSGNLIYVNPYLILNEKNYNVNYIDAFRVLCYGFFEAKVHDVMEKADVIEADKTLVYTKK